jgi:aminopeptidase-like protein
MADATPHTSKLELGASIWSLIERLYPICRSITGPGVRETLSILGERLPLVVSEVPSGTEVLDWTVPREWTIRDAWVKNERGERIIDFAAHNLHVVNYSAPVRTTLTLDELRPHLHSLPDRPDLIPYRTTYYEENWGFCLTHRQLESLTPGRYEVCIDSTLADGSLTYAECVLPGTTTDEILISTHVCHPSLCDDNLSGISISLHLAEAFSKLPKRRHTLRFLYAPGTIGAITWLANHRDGARRIRHGLTLTCLGDSHPFTYKRTLDGSAPVDRVVEHVVSTSGLPYQVIDYFPYGYDERQYNSPGFRIPVGSLMRGRHGQFPEYHTSGDNLGFVSPDRLLESYRLLHDVLVALDGNAVYRNLQPFGEPQLGRRGLYRAIGGTEIQGLQMAMLWVLGLSDGSTSLIDVARRSGASFDAVQKAASLLEEHGLLEEVRGVPSVQR